MVFDPSKEFQMETFAKQVQAGSPGVTIVNALQPSVAQVTLNTSN